MRNQFGKNNPNWKGGIRKQYYCIDCGRAVSKKWTKRCFRCQPKHHSHFLKTSGKMSGSNNPAWRGGKPKCIDCGIVLKSYIGRRCINCNKKFQIGVNAGHWLGGVTPEREAIASSKEWKEISQRVWKRDNFSCQLCGKVRQYGDEFHIHHIISFAIREFRLKLDNLVLLCRSCHHFVHSNKNKDNKYMEKIGCYAKLTKTSI